MLTMFEPIRPIPLFTYQCDKQFHLDSLKEMLQTDEKYGFIVVDGNGALFAVVQGTSQAVLYQYDVTLPKKHSKGGQSSVRFARLRLIARHNYLTRVNELAVKYFWDADRNRPSVEGIVLAGSADFKDQFGRNRLDPRLAKLVISVVDIAYGGSQGLNQAVDLASDVLKDVSILKQKKLVSRFFEEISSDSGKFCFGVKETLEALGSGVVETLLVWEKLDVFRQEVRHKLTGETSVLLSKEESLDEADDVNIELVDSAPLVDWLVDNFKTFGAKLEIVQDCTDNGSQFCKGFGGIGAILRYRQEFSLEDSIPEELDCLVLSDDEDTSEYWDEEAPNGKEEIGF